MDLLRESAVGLTLRYITGNKVLLYPEEKEGFSWPPLDALLAEENREAVNSSQQQNAEGEKDESGYVADGTDGNPTFEPITSILTATDNEATIRTQSRSNGSELHTVLTRTSTAPYTQERFDVERNLELEKSKTIQIAPTKTSDGTILVDWYTTDDPANPQNWTSPTKYLVLLQMAAYSLTVYGATSMYVPSEQAVMEKFHVGPAAAALGLAIYVVGYGVGPLIFAPLSEIPVIGRNGVYIPTLILFVILSIPTALVDNYAGLLVLRFLTGFFGSPILANGGATVADLYSFLELPIYLSSWVAACFWGPAIGPVVAGYAVQAKGWRWGLWEIVWLSAPILLVILFLYPETSADNILRYRAQRLRKLTGRSNIKSKSEIEQEQLKASEIFWDALIKPIEIMLKDPGIFFTNVYTSLIYGIYYSFFEVFPLVFPPIYGFDLPQVGLTFLTIGIGCVIGFTIYLTYQIVYLIPDIKKNGLRAPEQRLVPALFGVCGLPVGYFMFGWTARQEIHWIVPLIGVTILVTSIFLILQSVFVYLPLSYPKYAASLFAANDLSRSMFAAACIMFSRPMFINLGIGGGVSLLAGLACVGVVGMFALWHYGAVLRSKSTFAVSYIR